MREGISYAQALRLLIAGFFLGTCPACGRASMFRSLWELHTHCPACGVRHELAEGSWLGAVAVGYSIGALFAMALAVIELRTHVIANAGLDPLWTIALSSIPATVLAYRPAKGLWFVLLYLFGLAGEPDAPPAESSAEGASTGPSEL
jgi:uncharacterized protein (DUF983 family)